MPPEFRNIFFTGKNAEKMAKRYRALTGLQDDTSFTNLANMTDQVGSSLRVLKTGFDFGLLCYKGCLLLLGHGLILQH